MEKTLFVLTKWVRYKSEIYIIHFTFITDPKTKFEIHTTLFRKKWVRYKSEIYILHFTFITDPNKKFKEKFFTFQNWVHYKVVFVVWIARI